MNNFELLLPTIISEIESSILSNPKPDVQFSKITCKRNGDKFFVEYFTKKQAFQKTLNVTELLQLLLAETSKHYKNVLISTSTENITVLANKKGKQTILHKVKFNDIKELNETTLNSPNTCKPISDSYSCIKHKNSHNKKKKYLLQEGIPVPFLVQLGVMTKEGKVVHAKYNKFKQINRYLEFVDDIVENLIRKQDKETKKEQREILKPLQIVDFGCGKSYLTFALYHYLTELKGLKVNIVGLDLKQEVIETCSLLAKNFGYTGLHFSTGDIATYSKDNPEAQDPDMVMTLHACDTATDYALAYAVQHNAKVILSVPCCQHELNSSLGKKAPDTAFNSLLKYGLVKERFAALATDVMRAELLEQKGYSVQLLEFIDITHTPKNILIRAVRKKAPSAGYAKTSNSATDYENLCSALGQKNVLAHLLDK